jgi:hypothetical protein
MAPSNPMILETSCPMVTVVEKTNSPSAAVREPIAFAFDSEFSENQLAVHVLSDTCPF